MAGKSAERQERSFAKVINGNVDPKGTTITGGKVKINGVISASKFKGRQVGGSEPYTDIVLTVAKGSKIHELNVSLKGPSAPSLAGGGLKGIETIIPGLGSRFMQAVYDFLQKKVKLKKGQKVPDVYAKLSPALKQKIVVGNAAIGGPIDYMYIGPMTVTGKTDTKKNTITLNGTLIEAEKFADDHELYLRLRARREDQTFDPTAKDKTGTPKVYGVSPSKGDSAGRIVVTDSVPSNAKIITLR